MIGPADPDLSSLFGPDPDSAATTGYGRVRSVPGSGVLAGRGANSVLRAMIRSLEALPQSGVYGYGQSIHGDSLVCHRRGHEWIFDGTVWTSHVKVRLIGDVIVGNFPNTASSFPYPVNGRAPRLCSLLHHIAFPGHEP